MNDFSLKISIIAHPIFVRQKLEKKLLSQREYSRPSLIKNAWLIHSLVTCEMQITLATLLDIFNNVLSIARTK